MKPFLPLLAAFALMQTPLLAKDVDIAVSELPENVAAAVMKAHPGATLLSAEKDLKADGSVQHYEVKVRDGQSEKELTVLPDGTIQKTEKED
jgi:hypothetical protein